MNEYWKVHASRASLHVDHDRPRGSSSFSLAVSEMMWIWIMGGVGVIVDIWCAISIIRVK